MNLAAGKPPAADEYQQGIPWQGERGVRERTSDIMQRAAKPKKKEYRLHVHREGEFVEYIDPAEGPPPAGPEGPLPEPAASGQTAGLNFLGATLNDTLAYPPDSMGAAGPAQYIVCVNGRIRSFNKTSGVADGVLNADTDVFFQSVMTPPVTNNFTSDPRIRYDRLTQRWFAIMLDVPNKTGASPNRILLAVSDGPIISPGSSWTFFHFRHDLVAPAGDSGQFADYPTLGIDAHALYIGVNVFGTRGQGSFENTTAFVVRKSSLLVTNNSPTNIVVTAFRGLVPNGPNGGPYTPQGVDNFDPNANEGYVIGVTSSHTFLYFDRLTLRRISDPGGTPAISGNIYINIPLIGGTIRVPHLGNTGAAAGNLDGLDYRLLAACMRNGRLWTSQSIALDNTGSPSGTDTRMGMRWYELAGLATGQTPSVFQSGTVFQPSPSNTTDQRCFWMGAIMVTGQGHAAMGFSVAGANEFANAGWAGRLANDSPGTMRAPALYTASTTPYNPHDSGGSPISRWGDYSYTCVDPDDDMTLWTIQEFCNATNSYGVQVLKLLAPPPATPTNCSPSVLSPGVSNVNLVLIGRSDGDTGFFDPGAGFSNRLSAAINGGGVTVNSVTYNNRTNIGLNVSVASGAVPGGRTITVTNPDSQAATSASGLLTISAPGSNSPPTLAPIGDRSVVELSLLIFTNSASDPNFDSLTFSLVPGAPAGAAVNPTNGIFTWSPSEAQGPGTNSIGIRVTDSGSPNLSATQSFTVVILETNSAPTLTPIASRTIHAGTVLVMTNTASDTDLPTNSLTFSLVTNAVAGASLHPVSGVFTWATTDAQVNTTNSFLVQVIDNGSPNLSDTEAFAVSVVSRPIIQSIVLSNQIVLLSWSAISGQSYRVQSAQQLGGSNWIDLVPEVVAAGPTATSSHPIDANQRFYRVQVIP